jgi:hypothetical protein
MKRYQAISDVSYRIFCGSTSIFRIEDVDGSLAKSATMICSVHLQSQSPLLEYSNKTMKLSVALAAILVGSVAAWSSMTMKTGTMSD